MSQGLEQAKFLLQEGNILSAKNELFSAIKNAEDDETILEATKIFLNLFFNERKISEVHQQTQNIFNHLKQKDFPRQILNLVEALKGEYQFFRSNQVLMLQFEAWALQRLGKVQKAKESYLKLVKILDSRKQVDQLIVLLKELKASYPRDPDFYYYQLRLYIFQKKTQEFDDSFKAYFLLETKANRYIRTKELLYLANTELYELNHIQEFLTVILGNPIKHSKELLRLINSTINHSSAFYLIHLALYLNFNQKIELAHDVLKYTEKNHKKEYKTLKESMANLIFKLEKKQSCLTSISLELVDREELNEKRIEYLKIKLNHCLKYREKNNEDYIIKLIQFLDPFFVLDNEDLKENVRRDEKITDRLDNKDEIFQSLISQITYYTGNTEVEAEKYKDLKLQLGKVIDFYFDELSQNKINDYIIMLYGFQFYDLALSLLLKYKESKTDLESDLKHYLEIVYLEVSINTELKKHYDNLNLLSKVNLGLPLTKDEKVCFTYLEAETLYHLKRYKEALSIYKRLQHLENDYRLTNLRVRQIEKV